MKKIGDSPMKQTEMTRRYYDKNNLVLFAVRVEKELVDKLTYRLAVDKQSKPKFVKEAIKRYLEEKWFEQNKP